MLRTLFFSVILGAITLVVLRNIAATRSLSSMGSWTSPFALWHSRAQVVPLGSSTFTPSLDTLSLAVLLNSPAENEGFTLALFSQPREDGSGTDVFAIDAVGHTLLVAERDATGIFGLVKEVAKLPPTGAFRNTWIVKRPMTSQPIHRFFIFSDMLGSNPHEVSVQGFTKESTELKHPVEGIEELPPSLWELTGLVLEVREGIADGASRDEVSLKKVRDVVGSLF
ncbi:hypothetical protein DXG01_011074 [Tephrocybe rancida]|nr:hypothetical protein DXG01_011074 [Tephrocybe rancida]